MQLNSSTSWMPGYKRIGEAISATENSPTSSMELITLSDFVHEALSGAYVMSQFLLSKPSTRKPCSTNRCFLHAVEIRKWYSTSRSAEALIGRLWRVRHWKVGFRKQLNITWKISWCVEKHWRVRRIVSDEITRLCNCSWLLIIVISFFISDLNFEKFATIFKLIRFKKGTISCLFDTGEKNEAMVLTTAPYLKCERWLHILRWRFWSGAEKGFETRTFRRASRNVSLLKDWQSCISSVWMWYSKQWNCGSAMFSAGIPVTHRWSTSIGKISKMIVTASRKDGSSSLCNVE